MSDKPRDPARLKQKLVDFAASFPFFELMGFAVVDFGPRWSTCTLTHRKELCNPNGVLHGGAISTLIDAGITQAMLMTDEYDEVVRQNKGYMTTIDLRVRYLRPCSGGVLTCESKVTHLGRRIVHASAVVKGDDGKDVALGDSIMTLVTK